MDLDYRTLGNAGLWRIGRLQTDADRARVIEGLSVGRDDALATTIKRLAPRWFAVRNVHASEGPVLLPALGHVVHARSDDPQRGAPGARAA